MKLSRDDKNENGRRQGRFEHCGFSASPRYVNLEGKRILLGDSDVGQSKGAENTLGHSPRSHVVSLGVLWLGCVRKPCSDLHGLCSR
jgi:hypothetical protein